MQIRNDRAPRGVDVGQAAAVTKPRYNGSFAVAPSTPEKVPDDRDRDGGRFSLKMTDDPKVARRREWWRRAQQKHRDKKKEGMHG